MNWLELTIETAPGGIDTLAAALTAGGFADLVLEDQDQMEEFLEENRQYWDYIDEQLQESMQGLCQIKLYLENTDRAGLTRLQDLVDRLREKNDPALGSLKLTRKLLAETNWEDSWKENYPPQPVGKSLLVLPYWLENTDTEGRIPVILDPGLTFGTGAHPSTQMVMEAMEQVSLSGKTCLDLGSGSGILSIAALRLGAKAAIGVDIDPKAESIARENAAYNGFAAPEFTALTGNVTADRALMEQLGQQTYALVLVNIVADVIIALAPVLPRFMAADTRLICSGILDVRLPEVTAALEQAGLSVISVYQKEDWRCVQAKRR